MEKEKLDRINALARKAKQGPLTPEKRKNGSGCGRNTSPSTAKACKASWIISLCSTRMAPLFR